MLIAYRDYVKDATATEATWNSVAGAPLTNVQDRRLAVKAINDLEAGNFIIFFDEPVTIQFVAILAHNLTQTGWFQVSLRDAFSSPLYDDIFQGDPGTMQPFEPLWIPPVDSQFPRNSYVIFPVPVSGVRQIFFHISTGQVGESGMPPVEIGRVWAGPAWQPEGGTARRNFRPKTCDDSVLHKSIGQQAYADTKPRYRQLTCSIPDLSEAEAIGTEDGDTQNLQDIGFEVGRAGEVIVIPAQHSNQAIHKLGLFGHFLEAPYPELIEEASGHHYSATFDVVEDL